jgi:hypothetical protein
MWCLPARALRHSRADETAPTILPVSVDGPIGVNESRPDLGSTRCPHPPGAQRCRRARSRLGESWSLQIATAAAILPSPSSGTRDLTISLPIKAPAFDALHPRSTADGGRSLDGSSYPIDGRRLGENVTAGIQHQGHGAPLIELLCFVSDGYTVRLDSRRLSAAGPCGEPIAAAQAARWLNPRAPSAELDLGILSLELPGARSVRGRDNHPTRNSTAYRVVLTFDQALPEQFDLHAPDVWSRGIRHPVKVFGFRSLPNRGRGLCEGLQQRCIVSMTAPRTRSQPASAQPFSGCVRFCRREEPPRLAYRLQHPADNEWVALAPRCFGAAGPCTALGPWNGSHSCDPFRPKHAR